MSIEYTLSCNMQCFIDYSQVYTCTVAREHRYIVSPCHDCSQILIIYPSISHHHRLHGRYYPCISQHPSSSNGITVSIFITLPMPFYNVYTTYKAGKLKHSSFREVVRPLVPFSFLFFTSLLWASYSHTDVIARDPRIFLFTVGTVFSNISVSIGQTGRHKLTLIASSYD